ncbi:MAG: DNA-deoxyinosine glycosylase [Eubacterium aggregans]|uniref:DNA-deoxyinosine glycosylase n=1 Tax=Eubacterium aggregans TaxID=81409 RepID=UPI002B2167AD|nr:DNA-deoxyinosine glycosylase [Eubacterium aggregans]MEA5074172.1 DNA-deoxyinosine glycosylase [Eubacterium aggregans]
MAESQRLFHTLAPFCPGDAKVLILGTFPSPKSREMGFYYGHPQNRFWRVLAALFDAPVPQGVPERKDFLTQYHIALWDVLDSCTITGASDASIREPVANDLPRLLKQAPIKRIYTTGRKAEALLKRLWGDCLPVPVVALPSTSPANCRMDLDTLVQAYRPITEDILT